ncbi:MAG: glucokinase [Nitrospirota bacterium]|nr:glucokinase [Nitrospirota bacterium]
MILAGDIGGTKTYLGVFECTKNGVESVREEKFWNSDFESLEEILTEFLDSPSNDPNDDDDLEELHENDEISTTESQASNQISIEAACFGVAGPVQNNRCRATNLPWVIDGDTLTKHLETSTVRLLNDVEAMAYGVLVLGPDETELIHGPSTTKGNETKGLIAPGTGLGEAILFWDGHRYHPIPSEGGHSSFAPNTDVEIDLLRYLRTSYLHISFERILSGDGLHTIYQFLRDTKQNEPTWFAETLLTGDPAALIAEAGLNGKPDICVQALDLFVSILAGEAGNLTLKGLTTGGIYIGGGIAPQILPKLREARFLQAFVSKGRYKRLLSNVPVHVILNDKAALLGSASFGSQLLGES